MRRTDLSQLGTSEPVKCFGISRRYRKVFTKSSNRTVGTSIFGALEKTYGKAWASEEGFPEDREILAQPQKQFPLMFQGRICPVVNLLLPLGRWANDFSTLVLPG
jgi:hypothetical protein